MITLLKHLHRKGCSTVDWAIRRHKTTAQRGPHLGHALGRAPARAGPGQVISFPA